MSALSFLQKIERWNVVFAQRWGMHLLRYSLAIVYGWFGLLKPLGLSPACELVSNTIFWFSPNWFVPFLGIWEMAICVLLLFKPTVRYAVLLIYLHLPGTFLPMLIVPETSFNGNPMELTLIGQYIIKNFTLAAAAIMVGGSLAKSKMLANKTKAEQKNHVQIQSLVNEDELTAV